MIRLFSYYFASFMALKTKMKSFYALVRHLILVTLTFHNLITFFLVILLHFWLQNKKTTACALIFDIWSLFFCLVYGYSFTSFLTSKPSVCGLIFDIRSLFFCLVYSHQIRKRNFLRLDKNFVSCSFTLLMA